MSGFGEGGHLNPGNSRHGVAAPLGSGANHRCAPPRSLTGPPGLLFLSELDYSRASSIWVNWSPMNRNFRANRPASFVSAVAKKI